MDDPVVKLTWAGSLFTSTPTEVVIIWNLIGKNNSKKKKEKRWMKTGVSLSQTCLVSIQSQTCHNLGDRRVHGPVRARFETLTH